MHFVQAKSILTQSNGMNVYRGCMHGCVYCDSRSRCYQFTHPFEDIEVKENAPELLEQILRKKRKKIMTEAADGDIFEVKKVMQPLPEEARIYEAYVCEVCGEKTGAKWVSIVDGKVMCMDCLERQQPVHTGC